MTQYIKDSLNFLNETPSPCFIAFSPSFLPRSCIGHVTLFEKSKEFTPYAIYFSSDGSIKYLKFTSG